MSAPLSLVITQAGLTAVSDATSHGQQVHISHLALGDGSWSPDRGATSLKSERRRLQPGFGDALTPTLFHISAVEDGVSVEYQVSEIGFFLADGTLLAIWSNPDPAAFLAWKIANVDLWLAFDLDFSALPPDSVTCDDTGGISLAPATSSRAGVVQMATTEQALAGTVNDRVMSPADTRGHGDARYATLDHHHPLADILNAPSVYPPADHNHDDRYEPLSAATWTVAYGQAVTQDWKTYGNSNSAGVGPGANDPAHNWLHLYPPEGYVVADLQAVIASIGAIHFAGGVNQDDDFWCTCRPTDIQPDYLVVLCNNDESRMASRVNYLTIWKK